MPVKITILLPQQKHTKQTVPNRRISFHKHSQVMESAHCGADGHHSHHERRSGLTDGCSRLCSAEQCALMWFTGLTADSDEGMTLHVTLWLEKKTETKCLVSRPGERRLFRSLQTHLLFFVTL